MKLLSSIASKLILALTGLFLCVFLIVHLVGNLQLFYADHGLAFNKYAVFMTTNPLIATVSWGLYLIILFHAFKGLYLAWKNQRARKVGYNQYAGNTNSKWYSRSMGLLGTIILIFIVVHMSDFWYHYKFGYTPYSQYNQDMVTGVVTQSDIPDQDGKPPILKNKMEEFVINANRIVIVKDLYKSVTTSFQELWMVVLYVLAMVALSFHLMHGFQSAFQTMGVGNRYILKAVRVVGIWVFAILIPLAFAAIPVYMYLTNHHA